MISLLSKKKSPESLTARLNRISRLLLTENCLIGGSLMAQSSLLYYYQPIAAQGRHGDNA